MLTFELESHAFLNRYSPICVELSLRFAKRSGICNVIRQYRLSPEFLHAVTQYTLQVPYVVLVIPFRVQRDFRLCD